MLGSWLRDVGRVSSLDVALCSRLMVTEVMRNILGLVSVSISTHLAKACIDVPPSAIELDTSRESASWARRLAALY